MKPYDGDVDSWVADTNEMGKRWVSYCKKLQAEGDSEPNALMPKLEWFINEGFYCEPCFIGKKPGLYSGYIISDDQVKMVSGCPDFTHMERITSSMNIPEEILTAIGISEESGSIGFRLIPLSIARMNYHFTPEDIDDLYSSYDVMGGTFFFPKYCHPLVMKKKPYDSSKDMAFASTFEEEQKVNAKFQAICKVLSYRYHKYEEGWYALLENISATEIADQFDTSGKKAIFAYPAFLNEFLPEYIKKSEKTAVGLLGSSAKN